MSKIVIPPTNEIIVVSDLLNEAISLFLQLRDKLPPFGEYEAEVESLNLMYLIIRHVESISELARRDLALLPSSLALARICLETAVKIKWILQPSDRFEREVRWLAHLQGEEEYSQKAIKRSSQIGVALPELSDRLSKLSNFRESITSLLKEKGYKIITKVPDVATMMKVLQEEAKYIDYILLSQYIHATHVATGTYRRNLGIYKYTAENIIPLDWREPLSICWYSLWSPGADILDKLGGNSSLFVENTLIYNIQEYLDKI